MSAANDIKRISNAIGAHADLLAGILTSTDGDFQNTNIKVNDQYINLLVTARLIEEVDPTTYMEGENFELFEGIINTTLHGVNELHDIKLWKEDFKNACLDFEKEENYQLEKNSHQVNPHLKKVKRLVRKMPFNIRKDIRLVSIDLSNDMDRFGNSEEKETMSERHQKKLSYIQDEYLTRIEYKELIKHAKSTEIKGLVIELADKLNNIREELKNVLARLSDFLTKLKMINKRKVMMRKALYSRMNNQFEYIDALLNEEEIISIAGLPEEDCFKVSVSPPMDMSENFDRSVTNEVLGQIKLKEKFFDRIHNLREIEVIGPQKFIVSDFEDGVSKSDLEMLTEKRYEFMAKAIKTRENISLHKFYKESVENELPMFSANSWLLHNLEELSLILHENDDFSKKLTALVYKESDLSCVEHLLDVRFEMYRVT
jgi:hypothetical protein